MKKQSVVLAIILTINLLFAQTDIYVLCEGNFQTPNSTLWKFTDQLGVIQGPVHWDPNNNPLGDTGQSLHIANDHLFIVMNNSHTVEVVDLLNDFEVVATIDISGASPRHFTTDNNTGYLTNWNTGGIIRIDLSSYTLLDPIPTPGLMTEAILVHGGYLYVSSPMHQDWSNNDMVLKYNLMNPLAATDTFQVVPGPVALLAIGDSIFIASQYYDANWNANSGTSLIEHSTGSVTTNDYATDLGASRLVNINGNIYRTVLRGIAPLDANLAINTTGQLGDIAGVYSAGAHQNYIFIGHTTDYMAPDTVTVINTLGTVVKEYMVGAIPGFFATYSPRSATVDDILQPANYTLLKPYPNPFNAIVAIDFSIANDGYINLAIYDLNGKLIENLIQKYLSRGDYRNKWNGNGYATGIYFVALTIDGAKSIAKITLLK